VEVLKEAALLSEDEGSVTERRRGLERELEEGKRMEAERLKAEEERRRQEEEERKRREAERRKNRRVMAIVGVLIALIVVLPVGITQYNAYLTRSYNTAAHNDLRKAATAQEAFLVDHKRYSENLERLLGRTYGLHLSEGVTVKVVAASEGMYLMEVRHRKGDRVYHIEGPGGSVREGQVRTLPAWARKELKAEPPKPARTITNSLGMRFVWISPGTFMMGSPASESGRESDEAQHQVILTKGFYMQTTEVTQGQWKAVMGSNPSHFKNCGDDCPVEDVSWNDCKEFIRRLNQKEGAGKYRLPTEAEWEYACRAGSAGAYAGDLDSMGWYDRNSDERTHPAGQKKANAWGLYDMHGNVWEWCKDRYGDYPSGSVTDPKGPSSGAYRVFRGGSWYLFSSFCRSAKRRYHSPDLREGLLGFRLAGQE